MKYSLIPILGSLALLMSCGEVSQTIGYYKTHDAAREEKLAACLETPGEFDTRPNCVNAAAATREMIEDIEVEAKAVGQPYRDQIAALWDACPPANFAQCRRSTSQQATALNNEASAAVNQVLARRAELRRQLGEM